jgi:hypothetical protein
MPSPCSGKSRAQCPSVPGPMTASAWTHSTRSMGDILGLLVDRSRKPVREDETRAAGWDFRSPEGCRGDGLDMWPE